MYLMARNLQCCDECPVCSIYSPPGCSQGCSGAIVETRINDHYYLLVIELYHTASTLHNKE